MPQSPGRIWSNLRRILEALPRPLSKRRYFGALAKWIKEDSTLLGTQTATQYGLDWLSTLEPEDYPVELAGMVVSEEIASLIRQEPTTLDTIAMFMRDQLWPLATFKTSTECPNCGEDELRVLVDSVPPRELVLACDSCGWAQNDEGRKSDVKGTCRPATIAELRARGFTR